MKIKKSIGETFRKITKARGNELMIKKGVSSTILYLIQLLRTILSYIYKRWFQKCYFIQSYNPSCRKLSNRAQLTRRSYNYLRYVFATYMILLPKITCHKLTLTVQILNCLSIRLEATTSLYIQNSSRRFWMICATISHAHPPIYTHLTLYFLVM